MKIGIIGSSSVAQVLGKGLISKGHEVMLSSREPAKLGAWVKESGDKGSAGTFEEAARFGEVLFLCMNGAAAIDVLNMAGVDNFSGKTVVDVTNPLDFSQGTPPRMFGSPGDSLGERIQKAIPGAKVVKAFNTVSAYIMVNPHMEEGTPMLPICGDDPGAKEQFSDLARGFGWKEIVDMGGIDMAYWNEAFAMIWIFYGFRNNHWTHAFQLLRK